MNQLTKVFNYQTKEVRTITKDSEPWFVAKDVCDILEIQNSTQAIERLDEDEVTMFNIGGLSGNTNIINEFGLYNLVLGSRKKEAKQFKRWITHEVLPSIRKTGAYATETPTLSQATALKFGRLIASTPNYKMPALLNIMKMSGIEIDLNFSESKTSSLDADNESQKLVQDLLESHFQWSETAKTYMRAKEIFKIIGSPKDVTLTRISRTARKLGAKYARKNGGYRGWYMPETTQEVAK